MRAHSSSPPTLELPHSATRPAVQIDAMFHPRQKHFFLEQGRRNVQKNAKLSAFVLPKFNSYPKVKLGERNTPCLGWEFQVGKGISNLK